MTNDRVSNVTKDIIQQTVLSTMQTKTMNSGDRGTRFRVYDETYVFVNQDGYFVDISIRRALARVDALQRK
jgi:hypothetical protein